MKRKIKVVRKSRFHFIPLFQERRWKMFWMPRRHVFSTDQRGLEQRRINERRIINRVRPNLHFTLRVVVKNNPRGEIKLSFLSYLISLNLNDIFDKIPFDICNGIQPN